MGVLLQFSIEDTGSLAGPRVCVCVGGLLQDEEGEVPWVTATGASRATVRALGFILIYWKVCDTIWLF